MFQSLIGDLNLNPPVSEFLETRVMHPLTVLAGANNTGKSLVLKYLNMELESPHT